MKFLDFLKKLLRLLLKFMKITNEQKKWPEISTNSLESSFLPKGQKKPRSKAEALPGAISGLA